MQPIGLAFDENKREELHEAGKFRGRSSFNQKSNGGVEKNRLELKVSDSTRRLL